jgi:hypothetical protein
MLQHRARQRLKDAGVDGNVHTIEIEPANAASHASTLLGLVYPTASYCTKAILTPHCRVWWKRSTSSQSRSSTAAIQP